jgi:succinate dehydrogenase/fumarate reductase-like Fe-S protein
MIWRGSSRDAGRLEAFDLLFEEGESVLDGLVRLRSSSAPDLAFQYSCFNANVCKECVMLIDGKVEYACIAKLHEGEIKIEPIPSRPVVRDLLTDSRGRRERGITLREQIESETRGRTSAD